MAFPGDSLSRRAPAPFYPVFLFVQSLLVQMATRRCLVLTSTEGRPPPGLGEPWVAQEIGEVGAGLPLTCNKRPRRAWVDQAMARAPPPPWPGCPDAIAILEGVAMGAPWPAGHTWRIDPDRASQRPALKLQVLFPAGIMMTWRNGLQFEHQWFARVTALPYRCYFVRTRTSLHPRRFPRPAEQGARAYASISNVAGQWQ